MPHVAQFAVYTVEDLAELFQASTDWVRRGVQSRRFPHLRLGGKRGAIRFTMDHVHEIAAMHEQRPETVKHEGATETEVMDMSVFGVSRRSRARTVKTG